MAVITEVNINEGSSPVTVSDTSQEGNRICPEQSNESFLTETQCTSKFQCPADPGNWPTVIDEFRIAAMKRGPQDIANQILHFPADKVTIRWFSLRCCFHQLPKKEKIKRTWLLYSSIQDAVFLFLLQVIQQ
jgi:hypothetical protein